MKLVEIVPSDDLRPLVDRYWIRSAGEAAAPVVILPDGCADIVFDLSGSPGEFGAAFVVGTMTKPLRLAGARTPEMFGIRFRAGRAAAFLREKLCLFTDARVPAGDVGARELLPVADEIAGEPNDRRVAIVETAIRQRLAAASHDRRIDHAVSLIVTTSGRMSIDEVARRAGFTRQHMARLFDTHVGMTPKKFARVARFRRAISLGETQPWADVAAALGYADQSHLIADFREFAGTSPVPFFLSRQPADD